MTANTAWAVGFWVTSDSISQTLTEQWSGTSWTIVSSPNIGAGANKLLGVWGASSTYVFAVGSVVTTDSKLKPLIERYC